MNKPTCDNCINKSQCPLFGCIRHHRLWDKVKDELLPLVNKFGQLPDRKIVQAFERAEPPKVPQHIKDKAWNAELYRKLLMMGKIKPTRKQKILLDSGEYPEVIIKNVEPRQLNDKRKGKKNQKNNSVSSIINRIKKQNKDKQSPTEKILKEMHTKSISHDNFD